MLHITELHIQKWLQWGNSLEVQLGLCTLTVGACQGTKIPQARGVAKKQKVQHNKEALLYYICFATIKSLKKANINRHQDLTVNKEMNHQVTPSSEIQNFSTNVEHLMLKSPQTPLHIHHWCRYHRHQLQPQCLIAH